MSNNGLVIGFILDMLHNRQVMWTLDMHSKLK